MSKKLDRFLSPFRRLTKPAHSQDLSRSVLLLRLENIESLSQILDKTAVSHLIVQLSMTLGGSVRPCDPLQIVGPGLFAIVLRDRSERDAMQVGRRLHQLGQRTIPLGGRNVTPVLTGVLVHADAPDLPDVPPMTDNALRRIRALPDSALGRMTMYAHDPALATGHLAATVSDAIKAGEFEAFFQPQQCCHSGRITGFEALARWNHPQRGLLPPGAFMPQMTDADHNSLTLVMLAQSMQALKAWDRAGFTVPTVSINISNCELSSRGFADCLLWELDRHEIAPARLVVEVLESVGPVTSNAETRVNLGKLAKAGCHIDLDDFGTGYASLDAIRQFGIHRIKIDRSFVTACDADPDQQRMILAILALAERLGIAALAEGVETREEYAFLAQMGCDEVQGYAIARPMALSATHDFLTAQAAAATQLPQIAKRG
ncbi:EAL domain-containing protein [Paracoccus sp. 1_MG-2023]|uniref:EAL domain-containing protein n=1 Tax=unclassified Paracoccus (in: a-proteobacteria) TaxID=2688777 RepID=UPI001C0A22C2|nr:MULTISPECIES: EAL domain-containing protein [unclassified Paracoccus (in: a-proteobacteria)]MBU2957439.1 EAL domain-containing protein [Paracoccus sp. C2R09]MDO6669637.1 EAL domain-containing protein [Paracoccus sp. 1_MG-2023]